VDNGSWRPECSDAATWPKIGSSPPSLDFYERVTPCNHRSRHPTGGASLRLGPGATGSEGHHRIVVYIVHRRLVDDDI
jgi:hypothetical protein